VFQTTSDSEIIIQLIAHSRASTLVDCIAESLAQVDGAFSIVMMTRNRIFAARDPHGFPAAFDGADRGDGTVLRYVCVCLRDLRVRPAACQVRARRGAGELVMVSEDGVTSRRFSKETVPTASCIFEHVYFARPDSRIYGRWVQKSREEMGRQLARESHVAADLVVPVPDSA